ncbi:uncharacterized protein RDI95_015283 isoform 2-T11 [Morus bassanus]
MTGGAEQGVECWGIQEGNVRLPPVFAVLTLRKCVQAPKGQPAFKEQHKDISADCQQRKEASFFRRYYCVSFFFFFELSDVADCVTHWSAKHGFARCTVGSQTPKGGGEQSIMRR